MLQIFLEQLAQSSGLELMAVLLAGISCASQLATKICCLFSAATAARLIQQYGGECVSMPSRAGRIRINRARVSSTSE